MNELQVKIDNLPDQAPASSRFVIPSVDEVKTYMESLGVFNAAENAKKFWNFYDARGWLIGKTKMKSWKSAVNTWDLPRIGAQSKKPSIVG